VTTLDGQPLTYGKRDAGYANPHFIAWAREPLLRSSELPRVPQ
jgi:3'(2'), 5'-bisphosphate nucleotidase